MPDTHTHTVLEVYAHNILTAAVVGIVAILLASLMREPRRQGLMAVVLGVAAGAYLNGGFGFWEFPFTIAVAFCAYKGLQSYRFIGVGWVLHTVWDVLHHRAGLPMVSLIPTSSFECAVTDMILAAWFFAGAPSVFPFARGPSASQDTPN